MAIVSQYGNYANRQLQQQEYWTAKRKMCHQSDQYLAQYQILLLNVIIIFNVSC